MTSYGILILVDDDILSQMQSIMWYPVMTKKSSYNSSLQNNLYSEWEAMDLHLSQKAFYVPNRWCQPNKSMKNLLYWLWKSCKALLFCWYFPWHPPWCHFIPLPNASSGCAQQLLLHHDPDKAFDRDAKNLDWRQNRLFSKWYSDNRLVICKMMKLISISHLEQK